MSPVAARQERRQVILDAARRLCDRVGQPQVDLTDEQLLDGVRRLAFAVRCELSERS